MLGCTDATAFNYNATANTDDGSCAYGCAYGTVVTLPYTGTGLSNCGTDLFNNFSSYYTAGGSVAGVSGNYDNGDEAVYEFTASASTTIEVDLVGNTSYSGIFVFAECPTTGGDSVVAFSGSSSSDESLSFTSTAGASYYVVVSTWASPQCIPNFDLSILGSNLPGCIDSSYANFNPLATVDDSSCVGLLGCTDATATNYNSNASVDNGTCCYANNTYSIMVSACDSYYWQGTTYTTSGAYTNTLISNAGCDSIVTYIFNC